MAKEQISVRLESPTLKRIEALTVAINRGQDSGFGPRTRAEVIAMLLDTALPLAEGRWTVAPEEGASVSPNTSLVLPSSEA